MYFYNIGALRCSPYLNLPKRSFIEWLRFAPRKETKRVVKDTYNSTENHRLYVFVDDGTRAVFYQSK